MDELTRLIRERDKLVRLDRRANRVLDDAMIGQASEQTINRLAADCERINAEMRTAMAAADAEYDRVSAIEFAAKVAEFGWPGY